MKTFKLVEGQQFKAKDVLVQVLTLGGQQGMTFAEMRKRSKVIDVIEKAEGAVSLEDTDFDLLKRVFDGFVFAIRHPDLEAIGTAVEEASG